MKYCAFCGACMEDHYGYCPSCGRSMAVPTAPVAKKRPEPGVLGKSIAAVILGGTAIEMLVIALIFALCEVLLALGTSEVELTLMFCFYAVFLAIIGIVCGVIGLVLAGKALQRNADFRLAKISHKLSLAGLISCGAVLVIALMPLFFA